MKPIILLLALIPPIILFMICMSYLAKEPVRESVKVVEWQKIYRCCEGKCYLLKSMTQQVPVREVSYKKIYDNYNESTIIFSNRYCPK